MGDSFTVQVSFGRPLILITDSDEDTHPVGL